MTDDSCSCCGAVEQRKRANEREAHTDAAVATPSPLAVELPSELQSALGEFLGDDPVGTLDEWATEVRRRTGGGPVDIEELCHTETETGHWGELDGDRYHFACFYDAVILAAMAEGEVEIRTKSPDGSVIEAHAVGDTELITSPPDAVFSFGIDETLVSESDDPSLDDGYAAICPYVKAFPDPSAYDRWAEAVSVPTIAVPLAGATELAAELVRAEL